jgi:hypothetical protein
MNVVLFLGLGLASCYVCSIVLVLVIRAMRAMHWLWSCESHFGLEFSAWRSNFVKFLSA